MTRPQEDWKERASGAFKKYLDALERDLPPGADIVDIEEAMLKHYREMMSETFQALTDHQATFPPSD